jgi:hypothetical protein
MDQAATTSQPTAPGTSAAQAGGSEPLDLAKLTAEIEALVQMAATAAAPQQPAEGAVLEGSASTGSTANDLSQIEREIEALLAGGAPSAAAPDPAPHADTTAPQADTPAPDDSELEQLRSVLDESPAPAPASPIAPTPTADLRRDALVEPPSDPLLQEVDALLADDADSLLKASGGDIRRAVESVFDPRALSGQEEDVNRALIEAFGSTRSTAFSFGDAAVTNPAPRFAGVSKEVPPDMPRVDFERAARSAPAPEPTKTFYEIAADSLAKKPVEYAGEKPFEPAFPPLPVATPDPRTTPAAAVQAANAVETKTTPTVQATPESTKAPATAPRTDASEPSRIAPGTKPATVEPAPAANAGPSRASQAFARARRAVAAVACAPIAALAFPMRFVPANARGFVGIAAVTTVLWVPVAWWYASAQAKKPGVGPVALVERAGEAAAEATAEPEAAEKPKDSADSADSAAKSAH